MKDLSKLQPVLSHICDNSPLISNLQCVATGMHHSSMGTCSLDKNLSLDSLTSCNRPPGCLWVLIQEWAFEREDNTVYGGKFSRVAIFADVGF